MNKVQACFHENIKFKRVLKKWIKSQRVFMKMDKVPACF